MPSLAISLKLKFESGARRSSKYVRLGFQNTVRLGQLSVSVRRADRLARLGADPDNARVSLLTSVYLGTWATGVELIG